MRPYCAVGSCQRGRATRLRLVIAVVVLGCVRASSGVAPGGDPMIITGDQIESLHATNAYQVVAATHGDFLHSRGRESQDPRVPPIPAAVYVDDTFYGGVDTLRDIRVGDIAEIRLYQSYEAQYKFGSGHMGGVIQVITKL
jgi:hypothetical protein